MSLLKLNVADVKPLELATQGEHELRIIAAKAKTSQNTERPGILFVLKVEDEDGVENIFHSIWGAKPDDGEDTLGPLARIAKDFGEAFGLDMDSDSLLEDAKGQSAYGIVKHDEYEGTLRAIVDHFSAPK